ncbi:AhpC/TSA family protein [Riemerella anatipestifer]|uniref:Alkyl hydroperoxide reductase/ thiol specific antioxidant/ mal allergen n=4 Tax=Riemerella anatipestifer TaxID=34085 RepID=E4TBZ0_RIEAD|nr:TlpA disulfide reductase family protein [Riemerella anatipestifer]ADQ82037.1 alkyl hydroperoxide reductase/ Thiol specific antioxidant/ Mal allergen [Riemerella anatipestifer ATCC 11845 = DSM 15868]AFD56039.1 alkyl hydroperoxide reductase/ thiol specific antioxidant/ mal allergen [Riemerella anatipestifer ATCC 11845 = DSM 15868]AGC40046.1 hypothetical protein G148_0742 [Riemerella anatipestifer RA-CH-2]AKP69260.1 alkyl hydroperoxide reductase/ thiol specific antioxidant/ mal allergen [Riemer
MNKILTLILVLLCSLANSQNSFKISGKLKGFKENALVKIDRENIALDSCYLKDGNFKLKGSLKQSPSLVFLTIKNGEEWVYSSFFIGNENITINAEIKNFPYNVRAEGSKYDDLRYEFITLGKKLNFQRNEYLKEIIKLREQNKWNDSLQSAYWGDTEPLGKITKIDQELDKIQREFITKNLNSYYALHLLEESKTQYSKVELSNLVKKIKPSFRNTIYVKSISTYIKNPDLKIGDKFYDFSAINSKNKKVKFSDFFDGKYILLDFSTLFCGFCQQAIPELEKIKKSQYEKLEIVTFYVDESQKGFNGLLDKHGKDWKMIWDKKGRLSDTYAKYKVFGTPTFYLFNPKGILIKKFDGFYEDLSEQIYKTISNDNL